MAASLNSNPSGNLQSSGATTQTVFWFTKVHDKMQGTEKFKNQRQIEQFLQ